MAYFLTRLSRWYRKAFVEPIQHMAVVRAVAEEGRLSGRFAFMAVISGAIAILGLLLSSPAVVIGAMLLSPLMGPIMALGFALCILDFDLLKESLAGAISGILLALATAYGIVYLSPITDATPEILSRTQPNLFDLLVAIFAGLAGGYATINRKGETIVGVAIATALMPPLAVIGYGLATEQWNITHGATLLFMTNLLAIALSVTGLAKWYGFGARHSPSHTIWQTALILGVFGALSPPLGVALKNIATKAYLTRTSQAVLEQAATSHGAHISQFSISFPQGKPVQVNATLLTRRYLPDMEAPLAHTMGDQLGQKVTLEVDQLILARAGDEAKESQIAIADNPLAAPAVAAPSAPVSPAVEAPAPEMAIVAYAKTSLALPVKGQRMDKEAKTVTLVIGHEYALTTKAARSIQKSLAEHFPEWKVQLLSQPEDGAAP